MADRQARETWRLLRAARDAIRRQHELDVVTARIDQIHLELNRHDGNERCPCDRCRDLRTELYGKDSPHAQ
jgi:hypothetical protein